MTINNVGIIFFQCRVYAVADAQDQSGQWKLRNKKIEIEICCNYDFEWTTRSMPLLVLWHFFFKFTESATFWSWRIAVIWVVDTRFWSGETAYTSLLFLYNRIHLADRLHQLISTDPLGAVGEKETPCFQYLFNFMWRKNTRKIIITIYRGIAGLKHNFITW